MSFDQTLFDRINFDYPGLEAAREARNAGDAPRCLSELVRYYRSRTEPRYLFDRAAMAQFEDDQILRDAEQTMAHEIYGHAFNGPIDWHYNATENTSRDREWSWSLFRHIYWQPLARAYVLTGDEKYAAEFADQLMGFAKAWPAKPFLDDDDGKHAKSYDFPGHAWRTIETGIRIYTTWLPCFVAFAQSPSLTDEFWAVFLGLICDHGDFLRKFYSNHGHSSNWHTMEGSALLQLGIFFPEMKNAPDWKLFGYQCVTHEMRYSFNNDGMHREHTAIYHLVAAIAFWQAYRMCTLNGMPTPPYMLPALEKSAEVIMRMVKPDFSTPMIGDADRNDLLARRSDTAIYEGMNLSFDPLDLNEMRAFFRQLYEVTGREDFLYFATGRRQGKPPLARCYAMPDSGIFIMRTGWGEKDTYFHVHGVSLERGEKSSHSHNDTGHLELSIAGEDILVDSGRWIYKGEGAYNWREYFLSAQAHNTLYVDGHTMGQVPMDDRPIRGVRTYLHAFEETADMQLIDISHNGYAFLDDPLFHRRRVLRLPGDIFLIEDRMTGLGLRGHDMRICYNFDAKGTLEKQRADAYVYTTGQGRAYQVCGFSRTAFDSASYCGSENPRAGWLSLSYASKIPTPQLYFSISDPAPVLFLTVIAPQGQMPEVGFSGDAVTVFACGKSYVLTPQQPLVIV